MRRFVLLGGILGFLGVALGAFGAHVLESRIPEELLAVFVTGNRYHLVHALMLVLVGVLAGRQPHRWLTVAGWAFFFGVLVFSGTLYLLAATGTRWLGAITPLGGLALLVGWAGLVGFALRAR